MMKKWLVLQNVVSVRNSVLNEAISSMYKGFNVTISLENASCTNVQQSRKFHIYGPRRRGEDRREMLASMPARDEGTDGEKGVEIDSSIKSREDMFPDENTPSRLFNGIPFCDIPVCNIKATKNNTIITAADAKGKLLMTRSCGMEGFKNARKGTNVAAQATAVSISTKLREMGFTTFRVKVKGLGPGRMSAIKGLQMGGADIISVTDNTPVSWNPPRPRKQRRV